jgi:hypothetical protein
MADNRRDGPSFRDPPLTGAEVWLIGTLAELHAITAALGEAGAVAYQGTRKAMHGSDAGRYRQYLRLNIASAAPRQRTHARPDDSGGAVLIDLDAARRRTA